MNTTTELLQLLQKLNTMQTQHIKVLEERIEVLTQTIEIDKQTIKIQSETIIEEVKRYDNSLQPLESKHEQLIKQIEVLNHTIEIDKITIRTQEDTIKIYLDNLNSK